MHILLVLALGNLLLLVLGELATESTGLLSAKVQGLELLALVELAQARTLLEVHHSEGAGNVLAHSVDAAELARAATGDLLDAELKELSLELVKEREKVRLGLVVELVSANLGL